MKSRIEKSFLGLAFFCAYKSMGVHAGSASPSIQRLLGTLSINEVTVVSIWQKGLHAETQPLQQYW